MKPAKKSIEYYDYFECIKYLSERKGYRKNSNHNSPYDIFWHFVVDRSSLNNGTFWYMDNNWLNWFDYRYDTPERVKYADKIKPILEEFLAEFGEGENRSIYFKAEW